MKMELGKLLGEWVHPVEWGKVREFARAVNDPRTDPQTPPPTFPVVLTAEFIERFVRELLPLDRQRTVHGEQEYEYRRPLRIGQSVRCQARLTRDEVKSGKRGGAMRFVTVEIALSDADTGEDIGTERMTAIEKEPVAP